MGVFAKKEKEPKVILIDVEIKDYLPKCPHCEKGMSEVHRFLLNENEEAVYSCPHCHKIISVGCRV